MLDPSQYLILDVSSRKMNLSLQSASLQGVKIWDRFSTNKTRPVTVNVAFTKRDDSIFS